MPVASVTQQTPPAGFLLRSDAEVRRTLGRMRRIVGMSIRDAEFVWAARKMLEAAPREQQAQARIIRAFVERSIRFVRDPDGVETLTMPPEHLRRIAESRFGWVLGDCDDAATLSAALGMAVGIPASFTVLAFRSSDAPFQHVYTTLHPAGGAVVCDTTRDAQALPPVATRRLTVRV